MLKQPTSKQLDALDAARRKAAQLMTKLSGKNATKDDIAQETLDAYANLWSLTKETYANLGFELEEHRGDTHAEELESARLLETYDHISKIGGEDSAISKMEARLEKEADPKRRNNLALRIIKARIANGEAILGHPDGPNW